MSRELMLEGLSAGGAAKIEGEDASSKTLLIRGCDPVMAERAGKMLPPMLGNARIVSCTDDESFFDLLKRGPYAAVVFAPGACRHNRAGNPIPGGNKKSQGWALEEYRAHVRMELGAETVIVESTEEEKMVPLLRKALGLS